MTTTTEKTTKSDRANGQRKLDDPKGRRGKNVKAVDTRRQKRISSRRRRRTFTSQKALISSEKIRAGPKKAMVHRSLRRGTSELRTSSSTRGNERVAAGGNRENKHPRKPRTQHILRCGYAGSERTTTRSLRLRPLCLALEVLNADTHLEGSETEGQSKIFRFV